MAEQTKPALTEEEKRLNRQINYFIMRYMWQVVRGRKRDDGDTIYAAFDTSRERYTRIINTGAVRYGKGELDGLEQHTGLRKEIFSGEVRFLCPYTKNEVTQEISAEEWVALFNWRSSRTKDVDGKKEKSDKKEQGKKQKTCQDIICDKLKLVPRDDMNNWDFYRLCYYLEHKKAAPFRMSTGKLREIESSIKELSFALLDGCDLGQLQRFQTLLKEKQSLISAMLTYKNARNKARQK